MKPKREGLSNTKSVQLTNTNSINGNELPSTPSSTAVSQQRQRARRIETTYFLSRQVKLVHPDEAYGSKIWMGLPQVVSHRLDSSSPLVPSSPVWYDETGIAHTYPMEQDSINNNKKRKAGYNGNSASSEAAIVSVESQNQYKSDEYYVQDLIEIEKFLLDREAEIVVLVEGTDEGTGAPTQARHSYKVSDLEWNHTFVPCVFPYESSSRRRRRSRRRRSGTTDADDDSHRRGRQREQPVCSIDFMRFHDTVEVPPNTDSCAYIPHECYRLN